MKQIKIERKRSVLQRVGFGKTKLHNMINRGEFPPQISLGGRAVGFLSHEVDAFVKVLAQGGDVKEAVKEMINRRQEMT